MRERGTPVAGSVCDTLRHMSSHWIIPRLWSQINKEKGIKYNNHELGSSGINPKADVQVRLRVRRSNLWN